MLDFAALSFFENFFLLTERYMPAKQRKTQPKMIKSYFVVYNSNSLKMTMLAIIQENIMAV